LSWASYGAVDLYTLSNLYSSQDGFLAECTVWRFVSCFLAGEWEMTIISTYAAWRVSTICFGVSVFLAVCTLRDSFSLYGFTTLIMVYIPIPYYNMEESWKTLFEWIFGSTSLKNRGNWFLLSLWSTWVTCLISNKRVLNSVFMRSVRVDEWNSKSLYVLACSFITGMCAILSFLL